MGTTDSQKGRWQRGHPPPAPAELAWEPLPDSPQDVSPPTPCPSYLWPPLLFPALGGEAEPGWELQLRAFTFPLLSPIFKSFSSKMIRQVGAALPVGCGTSPSHGMEAWPQAWHHHTPITPGEMSPLCRVGQGDKSLSIHPTLGRGCPSSLASIHQGGDGRTSPCVPLLPLDDIKGLKKLSGSVQVSASHTEQGGPEAGNLKVQRDSSGCTCCVVAGEWVSRRRQLPFGDRAVAPQSNNPLPGLLSLATAARVLC